MATTTVSNPIRRCCSRSKRRGEYVLTITDALFRGREDFVYRITVGELPFVTHLFPLGGRVGTPLTMLSSRAAGTWTRPRSTRRRRRPARVSTLSSLRPAGLVSNPMPFVLDTLPEVAGWEPNDTPTQATPVQMPIIVNGRIDRSGDWDVFRVTGRAGDARSWPR